MSAPTLRVLIGFQTTAGFGQPFQLDNSSFGKLDTGTLGGLQIVDLTSMVQSVAIDRGRNRELEQFNAGTASIRFYDPQRILDPLNASSPYYPFAGPRNPVQVLANDIPIYSGLVGDWDVDYGKTESANITTAKCADAFTVLANQVFDAWTPSAQSSGARVSAVLARTDVLYQGPVSISAGASTLGAYAVSAGANVLNYLQLINASEQGYLFIAADGTLTFRGRSDQLNQTASVAFTDNGTGIEYQTLNTDYSDQLLYNYVQTQSPAGAVQIASDATSIALYQPQQFSKLDLLNSTTAEVASLGQYLLGRYKDPVTRFTGVSVQLAALSIAEQNSVLALDVPDIATVQKSFSAGSPSSVLQTLITSGVAHDIRPGSHTVRFTFESADQNAYLTLDNAIFGTLDVNLLAF